MNLDYQFITYENNANTAIITIKRPEVYNALNALAKLEIMQALREAHKTPGTHSIILTGHEKAFCTGQDLNDPSMQIDPHDPRSVDLGRVLEEEWNPLIKTIRESKKIIIAAINGVCAGAGISLATSCDLVIAKPGITFSGAFSKVGLAPDAGLTYTLTKALGYQKTIEFFLLGQSLSAEQMHAHGLINILDENVMDCAFAQAAIINKLSPNVCAMIKHNIRMALDSSFNDSIEREIYTQRFLGHQHDYREGLSAFLEKRPPVFTDQ